MKKLEVTGYLMIITGGFLNAIERMFLGSVTDFLSLKYFSVFNVADMAITAGVIVLLLGGFFRGKEEGGEIVKK